MKLAHIFMLICAAFLSASPALAHGDEVHGDAPSAQVPAQPDKMAGKEGMHGSQIAPGEPVPGEGSAGSNASERESDNAGFFAFLTKLHPATVHFPVALEGALKLKEISYIHAEAYAAGELKHGPLALVDSEMPVVSVAPNDELLEKLKSNLQEVRARGGELYVFADKHAHVKEGEGIHVLNMPAVPETIAPIVYTVPLQLLSYHVAVLRGTDVDQPRNLAKSVTVE